MQAKRLLSFGHGYSASALEKSLLETGWEIYGTTRSNEQMHSLKQRGILPLLWQDSDSIIQAINNCNYILISIAPSSEGDIVFERFSSYLQSKSQKIKWMGYLSTTGVYGDHAGEWVDEHTPLSPTTKRGHARVYAEKQWQSLLNISPHIFRLAGIYGPGRGPFSKVKNGSAQRIIKKDQVFSRIHVDDIAQVLYASISNPNPGAIYNLCDDDPAPPQDVIAYAATLLGKPTPPAIRFEDAQLSPMARSFYSENKRVKNNRIKSELGVKLKFPNYKSGLKALLKNESTI